MNFDMGHFLKGGLRQVSEYDVSLARDMFTLGFEAGMFSYDTKVHWADFTKDEMLATITNDVIMKSVLKEIFESGKRLGERRKKKNPENT